MGVCKGENYALSKKNKVKFNIRNVHYALLTKSDDGEVTYGTPVPMPSAVSISLEIDGKQVPFKASAAIPRIYRIKFGRDIYKDLSALEKTVGKDKEESSSLDMFSLVIYFKGWKSCNYYS